MNTFLPNLFQPGGYSIFLAQDKEWFFGQGSFVEGVGPV